MVTIKASNLAGGQQDGVVATCRDSGNDASNISNNSGNLSLREETNCENYRQYMYIT